MTTHTAVYQVTGDPGSGTNLDPALADLIDAEHLEAAVIVTGPRHIEIHPENITDPGRFIDALSRLVETLRRQPELLDTTDDHYTHLCWDNDQTDQEPTSTPTGPGLGKRLAEPAGTSPNRRS